MAWPDMCRASGTAMFLAARRHGTRPWLVHETVGCLLPVALPCGCDSLSKRTRSAMPRLRAKLRASEAAPDAHVTRQAHAQHPLYAYYCMCVYVGCRDCCAGVPSLY